jgi:uncharacterized protein YndB with AHSA1/START domain
MTQDEVALRDGSLRRPICAQQQCRAGQDGRAGQIGRDTGGIGARWWPLSRIHTGPDPVDCAIEPRVGGRVFERAADGRETPWGIVLAYDPPHRLAFSWVVELAAWQEQLVEICFLPEDGGTTVELTHSGWEKLGDAAPSQRERYDRGWGTVFGRHFVEYVNSAAI